VLGLNIQGKVFIESFNTFNGSTGSVNLTLPIAVVQTAVALTAVAPGGIGGGIAASVSSSSSTTMTINSMTSGVIVVGQLVQAITSVPAGTYVSAIGTFDGTSGTIILSQATTGVISDQACGFSAFIETPWYVTAAANVGDIVKIGIKN
jgi:hypothetical protein